MRTAQYIRNLQNDVLTDEARVDRILDRIEEFVKQNNKQRYITIPLEKHSVVDLLRHLDFEVYYIKELCDSDEIYEEYQCDYSNSMEHSCDSWKIIISW